jgi:hypothetical protein
MGRWTVDIHTAKLEIWITIQGSAEQIQAIGQRRDLLVCFMGWNRREDPKHPLQAKLGVSFSRQDQMTQMWRIERAAKDSQPHSLRRPSQSCHSSS